MHDKRTISVAQLFALFPDQEIARVYLEKRLWPNGPVCPICAKGDRVTARKAGFYRCNPCKEDFTVRTGTIFERSHIPLNKWLYAMYLILTARKSVSSLQMSKEIGITQKSAWFMLHRIREACGDDASTLYGTIEVDETYIGGKEKNKHKNVRKHLGTDGIGKIALFGKRERGGKTLAMPVCDTTQSTLQTVIAARVDAGSIINSDESGYYHGMDGLFYRHKTINHGKGVYVNDGVSINGIESVWALLNAVHGTFHHISARHAGRYVNEFAFRLNDGNVKRHTTERLASMVNGLSNLRPTYKRLIAK